MRSSPDPKVYRGALVGLGGIARLGHLPAFRTDRQVASRLQIVGIVDDAPNAPRSFDGIPLLSQPDQLSDLAVLPIGEVATSYYLRMRVLDRPGVLADITRILADRDISIDAMSQKEPPEGEDQTDIIMLTHRTIEKFVVDAIAKIEALSTVRDKVVRIRLEELN